VLKVREGTSFLSCAWLWLLALVRKQDRVFPNGPGEPGGQAGVVGDRELVQNRQSKEEGGRAGQANGMGTPGYRVQNLVRVCELKRPVMMVMMMC